MEFLFTHECNNTHELVKFRVVIKKKEDHKNVKTILLLTDLVYRFVDLTSLFFFTLFQILGRKITDNDNEIH